MWNPFNRSPEVEMQTAARRWHFSVALLTDKGSVRTHNEDAGRFLHAAEGPDGMAKGVLGVVADGMGGHQAGETASSLAVEIVCRAYREEKGEPGRCLENALLAANRAVFERAATDQRLSGMGTTCTALVLCEGLAYMAHVGDSRLYLIRDNEIYQMTEDHSQVMEMVRQGLITAEQARTHPDRNVLHRALGRRPAIEIARWREGFPIRKGDRYLLCSDGLSGVLTDDHIRQVAVENNPAKACAELIALTLKAGAPDNVTVGIVEVQEPEEKSGELPPTREVGTFNNRTTRIEAPLK